MPGILSMSLLVLGRDPLRCHLTLSFFLFLSLCVPLYFTEKGGWAAEEGAAGEAGPGGAPDPGPAPPSAWRESVCSALSPVSASSPPSQPEHPAGLQHPLSSLSVLSHSQQSADLDMISASHIWKQHPLYHIRKCFKHVCHYMLIAYQTSPFGPSVLPSHVNKSYKGILSAQLFLTRRGKWFCLNLLGPKISCDCWLPSTCVLYIDNKVAWFIIMTSLRPHC